VFIVYTYIHLSHTNSLPLCFGPPRETYNHPWSRSANSLRHNSGTHEQIVLIDAEPSVSKQVLPELQIMHGCNLSYICGAFVSGPAVCVCMEFMDKQIGAIDIGVVGRVALAILKGLTYLYDAH
jgi:hypothetical protein